MDPAVELALRITLVVLFLSGAIQKLRAFAIFRETLADYRLLPRRMAPVAALWVVSTELALACGLVITASRAPALIGAASLLILYGAAIGINFARGRRHIDCGCAGPATDQPLSEWLVLRNVGVVAVALACLIPVSARPLVWADGVTVVGSVVVLAAFYGSLNRLIALGPELARLRSRA